MCTQSLTYIHTHVHTYIHTYVRTYSRTYTPTYIHSHRIHVHEYTLFKTSILVGLCWSNASRSRAIESRSIESQEVGVSIMPNRNL